MRVLPPGSQHAAEYTPAEAKIIREHVTGADGWDLLRDNGIVTDAVRQAFREALEMHEIKAATQATILGDDEPDMDLFAEAARAGGAASLADRAAEAAREREQAVRRVVVADDPGWGERALAAVLTVGRGLSEFIVDDVWREMGEMPSEPRIMGRVMQESLRRCVVAATIDKRQSPLLGQPVAVWRSMVYREPPAV